MSVSAISGGPAPRESAKTDKVDLAAVAASKALRVQRDQAEAMVGLIEQASAGIDIGRVISVRA